MSTCTFFVMSLADAWKEIYIIFAAFAEELMLMLMEEPAK